MTTGNLFQSTLLQEERHGGIHRNFEAEGFQSTLLQEERPHKHWRIPSKYIISIHAPTRGATLRKLLRLVSSKISIHAPTRGATDTIMNTDWLSLDFNPRSYKRSDVGGVCFVLCGLVFQSTLLQEERLYLFCICSKRLLFQSTLLQEERQQKCTIFLMHLCNNYCIVSI